MASIPIGLRTRRHHVIIEERTRSLPARRSLRKRGVVNEEDDDDDDIQVVDESEYLRRIAKINSIKQNTSVEKIEILSKDDNSTHANDYGNNEEGNVDHDNNEEGDTDHDNNEEGMDIAKGDRNVKVSDDDSVQIIEAFNRDYYDESRSSFTSSDSDGETTSTQRGVEDELSFSTEMADIRSPLEGGDEKGTEKDKCNGVCSEANADGGDNNGNRLKSNFKKRKRVSSGDLFGKRMYDGLVLPEEPENNAPDDDFVGRRTRSHRQSKLSREKRGDGTFSHPVAIDDESSSFSDSDKNDAKKRQNSHKPDYTNTCANVSFRKRGRRHRNTSEKAKLEAAPAPEPEPEPELDPEPEPEPEPELDSEPENDPKPLNLPKTVDDKECEGIVKKKRRRPPKSSNVEKDCSPPMKKKQKTTGVHDTMLKTILENSTEGSPMKKKQKTNGVHDTMLKTILENSTEGSPMKKKQKTTGVHDTLLKTILENSTEGSPMKKKQKTNGVHDTMLKTILENSTEGLETLVSPASEMDIPKKFRFPVKKSLPEKTEEEKEIEGLFNNLEISLRACDIGCSTSCSDEDEENVDQRKPCCQEKHYLILDDEIGIRCKYCSFVKLEIRHVIPAFDDSPFGKSENRNRHWPPYDGYEAYVSNGFHIPESQSNSEHTYSDDTRGTVWDLVPGVKKTLYPHQQEAFEFMWKNVGGTTQLDELGKLNDYRIGGCIVCHAPGTGKTRLAITFLESFMKKFLRSKLVIISPSNMLLTWEAEFSRWNVDVPFYNLNKPELSGKEDIEVLKSTKKNMKGVRNAKLCSWAMGKGILGVSYRLFAKLAGESKGKDGSIKRALLEIPDILVLDEGHTPRNDGSNIWNVLTKVKTKRRIILSGTPFQNNFEELHNTLSLVREEFANPLLLGGCLDDHRRISELRKRMKPFVHVHKGEILKKTLRGLFHSVLFLKPSNLQKTCCKQLSGVKYIIEQNHLVSIACVHPSLLAVCNHVPEVIDKAMLEKHKTDLEVGLKMRFLLELINLVVGEKILVFSQYLDPLNFIAELLKSRYRWTEGKEYLYMQGQQDPKQRQSFINLFNDPSSEVKVLLASTKACGEGISLIGASRVVLLDVVWNPSVERQAISRAYRIGQQKDVFVYHLILSGTLEEEKYYRLVNKDRLSEMVFSSEGEVNQMSSNMMSGVSEDRVLEEMIENEKTSSMFVRIVRESKADELIKSFNPVNP